MFTRHVAAAAIKSLMAKDEVKKPAGPVLDSAADDDSEMQESLLDGAQYASADVKLKAVAALQEWAETAADDLDKGEGMGDRLFGLMVGIADADMDGEIGEDEADLILAATEAAADYLSAKGVSDDDITELLESFDNETAERVQELLVERLPDGDDAAAAEMDAFAFGDSEAALDAVYKKKLVVRGGKKMRINKRVSGTVRLSAKQKIAVRKMLRKSHSAKAQMRRAKSMRIRKSMAK